MDYVPHTGRRFTVSYEMKANVTWIYSVSYFANVEGALIFAFMRANGKPEWPIGAKKDKANMVYFDYSAFANSCPLLTDTFLFPLIHSDHFLSSSNKF